MFVGELIVFPFLGRMVRRERMVGRELWCVSVCIFILCICTSIYLYVLCMFAVVIHVGLFYVHMFCIFFLYY